jgi:hypothetical protein
METGNKAEMNLILRQYKDNGVINFPMVMSIPSSERIPALAKQDFTRINMLVIGALTLAMESLNTKRRLNEIEILDLSETIIDSANEDNLSFEDLMLFLQKMTRGEYKVPAELDIPKFMEIFEIYREQRHQELHEYRYNQHLQYKGIGDATRVTQKDELSEHFSSMGDRMHQFKETISKLKQENYSLKIDNE